MPGAQQSRLQLLSRVVNEPGPYRPIDCGVHDRLLALATRGQLCDLDVAAPGFGAHRIHGVIVNVYSEAGAEVIRADATPCLGRRALGWFLVVGGVGYVLLPFVVVLAPNAGASVALLPLPATVGEVWMIGLLLWIGLRSG